MDPLPRFFVDRGGTFTDCIGWDPGRRAWVARKVLSSDEAPLVGVRAILGLGEGDPIPPCELRLGTTVATNALLERRGARTLFVTTAGFEDLLEIGDQTRPDLFDLRARREPPLAERSIGVAARGTLEGEVGEAFAPGPWRERFRAARADGLESAAVALMHATRVPALEGEVAQALEAAGFSHVACSSEVDPEVGLLARAETTVADAYVGPLLGGYLASLAAALPGSRILVMQSSGALAPWERMRGRDAILSGPAGGAVAVAYLARKAGAERALGFDMGGTSTDVCRFDGAVPLDFETEVAGVRLRAPAAAVRTVAAGGGSLCRYRHGRLKVGPESAGATPGPACYGREEAIEPTLTDVQLVLGRLPGDRFPFALDEAAARRALGAVVDALAADGDDRGIEATAVAFFEIALETMAEALGAVTAREGHDASTHALIVFGGAGGQHACALARRLGIRRLIFPALTGALSAFGIGVAAEGWHGAREVGERPLGPGLVEALAPDFAALEAEARAALGGAALRFARRVDLRPEGSDESISIAIDPATGDEGLRAAYEGEERARFGYVRGREVSATVIRIEAEREVEAFELPAPTPLPSPRPLREVRAYVGADFAEGVPVHLREDLGVGARLEGPALVLEDTGTLVLEPGFSLEVAEDGRLELADHGVPARPAITEGRDPAHLEIMAHAFASIAEQMGAVLGRAASSTNIRERRDYSCAIFDAEGALVANAPHIPVHLGAMGETVRAIREAWPDPEVGDVFASNDPFGGGSHLPDITVVTPAFDAAGEPRFFVASRGHHADVGGITPGSMPAFSTHLGEEGVVLEAMRIVHRGRFERERLLEVLGAGPHPARRPGENIADLEAQIAANRRGLALLEALVERVGVGVVAAYMRHLRADAAERVEVLLAGLPAGRRVFADALDDGTPIRVSLEVRGRRLSVNFTGTGPEQSTGNLNAPRAVTVAALLYVLRCLVGRDMPLNAGCLDPVDLVIERGSILDPRPGRAVAGGNVETSQRVVDVLLGAFGAAAASQGTMNNLSFGDATFGYYETLGGGGGAGPGFEGASAVHTHMTNSRITDPELLEGRHPLRVIRFERRRGSGGAGRHPGGDGLVRELEALAPLSVSIVSERRERAPFGLEGGAPGARGRNSHEGRRISGRATLELSPGERLRVETPGGGGFGEESRR